MEAAVVASSHYLQRLENDEPPPSLANALRESCRSVPRRLDRFIQLALLGSARCAAGRALRHDCGIYLGSGLGPLSSTIQVQEQMLRDRLWPKPFNFVNTLGSCAGFYVAGNLGLDGPNVFVSRRGQSFIAALTMALTDFAAGVADEALVGVVEEAPPPLNAQRKRMDLDATATLAEGSHWLWLANRPPASGERQLSLNGWGDDDDLDALLPPSFGEGAHVCLGNGLAGGTIKRLRSRGGGAFFETREATSHDSDGGAWLVDAIDRCQPEVLWLIGDYNWVRVNQSVT